MRQRYSKLSIDRTNGPTAAAAVLQNAPTFRPTFRMEDTVTASIEEANKRLKGLEDVTSELKTSQQETLDTLRDLAQLLRNQ